MWYDSTKSILESVVAWLESGADDDDAWEDQLENAGECLLEMQSMSQPMRTLNKTGTRSAAPPAYNPVAGNLQRAIPHVESMINAMRSRNHAQALEQGRAALTEM